MARRVRRAVPRPCSRAEDTFAGGIDQTGTREDSTAGGPRALADADEGHSGLHELAAHRTIARRRQPFPRPTILPPEAMTGRGGNSVARSRSLPWLHSIVPGSP